jgi:phosphatidylglycerol:prolipoprotein diacylglycerol transferase
MTVRQILFQWGPFSLPAYGFFVGLGCIVGMHLAEQRGRYLGLPRFLVFDTLFVAFLGGLVGAKYLYFPFANAAGLSHSAAEEGRAFFGSMAGALVAAIVFLRVRRAPILRALDATFLYVPLGHSIGRLGCWFFGCCYGKVCGDSIFGVQFPRLVDCAGKVAGSPPFLAHMERGLVQPDAMRSVPVYPTQVLAVLLSLMIFVCLRLVSDRKWAESRPGSIVFSYCILYGIARWVEELLRDQRVLYNLMTMAQFVCLGMLIFGSIGLGFCLLNPPPDNDGLRAGMGFSIPPRRKRRRQLLALRKQAKRKGCKP